jgi:hypothetical protein
MLVVILNTGIEVEFYKTKRVFVLSMQVPHLDYQID